ncbi:MAG: hypothetical protein P8K73_00410 [Methylophilaceae bacterium]|nr:hypothetical protein [Methylophilaceae bacterium]
MGIKTLVCVYLIWIGLLSPISSYSKTSDQIKIGIKNTLLPDHYGSIKESKIKDPDILLKELESYNSYRPSAYRDLSSHPYSKETKNKAPRILFKELENYESYRPDSFSDASRNPFGDKKYKSLEITAEQ